MDTENRLALLVEDDVDLAHIFSRALQTAGYQTEIFFDGSDALTFLGTSTPEIIILDLHLPGTKGFDILKYIRAEQRLAKIRVIVITGDRVGADEVRDAADLVLIKPISFAQFRELASRLYSSPV